MYVKLLYKFYRREKKTAESSSNMLMRDKKRTHCPKRIKQALVRQGLAQTRLITLPPPAMTPTHHRPRPVNPRATAAKQQIVIQLILFSRRPTAAAKYPSRSTLDGEHDRPIVRRRKDVPTKPVRLGFPPKRIALPRISVSTQSHQKSDARRPIACPIHTTLRRRQ